VYAGGGAFVSGGLLRIRQNVGIIQNRSGSDCGGLRVVSGGVLDMANAPNSRIANNAADRDGGGLCLYDSVAWIGSVVSDNTAGRDGGGIAVLGNSVALLYPTNATRPPTISGNRAGGRGGGISRRPGTTRPRRSSIRS
jgi:hypothetical protein